jgi:hypothetical protein
MAVIEGNDYRDLAVAFANARDQILGARQYLFDAVYLVVLLQSILPEVDLLNVFWDTYNINLDTLESPTLMMSAVRALNQHAIVEGGFSSIDGYLQYAGITVPQTWADLSQDAGYTIDDAYIA